MQEVYLSKPITINGKETDVLQFDIDLLTAWDFSECKKLWQLKGFNRVQPIMALDNDYAIMVAAKALKMPYEDLMTQLTGRDYIQLGQTVVNFLLGAD